MRLSRRAWRPRGSWGLPQPEPGRRPESAWGAPTCHLLKMRRVGSRLAAALAASGDRLIGPAPRASADKANRRTPVAEAVRKAQPSVVSISSEKKAASTSRWPFTSEETPRPRVSGMGTGVILDGRGYILTNHHVVDKVQGIEVHLADGTVLPARVVQSDEEMDLAILKVDAGRPLAADRDRHLGRPDGRRDGHHDRQRLRLREHGLRRGSSAP